MHPLKLNSNRPISIGFVLGVVVVISQISLVLEVAAASKTKPRNDYQHTVNMTLDYTLLVALQMREAGLKPTWKQIQDEVCRRMGVKRVEVWQKKK